MDITDEYDYETSTSSPRIPNTSSSRISKTQSANSSANSSPSKRIPNVRCGIILVNNCFDMNNSKKQNKFLMVFQKASRKWGFPKGGKKPDEEPRTTAIRELFEETGFEVDISVINNAPEIIIHSNHDTHIYYVVWTNENPDASLPIEASNSFEEEITGFRWHTYESILERSHKCGLKTSNECSICNNKPASLYKCTLNPITNFTLEAIYQLKKNTMIDK